MIKPIGTPEPKPPIIFKHSGDRDCQPIRPQASQSLKDNSMYVVEIEENGEKKTIYMTEEQLKYHNQKEAEKQKQRLQEEAAIKQQEWLATINRPGKYTQVSVNENNKNRGFQ